MSDRKAVLKNKRFGQSTVEYIVLVTAVISVAILFLNKDGIFRTKLEGSMNQMANQMLNVSNRLSTAQ